MLANHPRYLPKFYKEESTFTLNGDTVKTQTVKQAGSAPPATPPRSPGRALTPAAPLLAPRSTSRRRC